MSFIVKVTYMQHKAARTAGHIIAFVRKPQKGRNSHWLDGDRNAWKHAATFDTPEAAEAALDSVEESPNRVSFEIVRADQAALC